MEHAEVIESFNVRRVVRAMLPRGIRNWLRSPWKSAHWMVDQGLGNIGFQKRITMRPGWELSCHPAAYRCAYHVQDTDPVQKLEFDCFLQRCSPDMVLFDLGAHFGLFSLAALHYGGSQARAIAVDPSPTAIEMIRHQARLNGVTRRLETVQAFAGEGVGERGMVDTGVQGAGYFVAPKGHSTGDVTYTPSISVDELARRSGLHPTHLKIDVEGYEAEVLRGAEAVLTGPNPPLLFLEIHNEEVGDKGEDLATAINLARSYGYRIQTVEGASITDAEIFEPKVIRVFGVKK